MDSLAHPAGSGQHEDRLPLWVGMMAVLNPYSMLDIGAGDGHVPDWLSDVTQNRAEITGLELNTDAVQRMREEGHGGNECSALSEYPFNDGHFDVGNSIAVALASFKQALTSEDVIGYGVD